jgi:hypothetical protein
MNVPRKLFQCPSEKERRKENNNAMKRGFKTSSLQLGAKKMRKQLLSPVGEQKTAQANPHLSRLCVRSARV